MITLGVYNTLLIQRQTEPGLFLSDKEGNEVLLPKRYAPKEFKVGEEIEVFVYLDNEERPVSVTDKPFITRGEFALLRCNQVTKYGAFLDWGMLKELFCPFKEQVFKMKKGGWYLVYCYLDEQTNRLVASSRTNRFLDNTNLNVKRFDEVDLIVSHPSPLGMNVIVNKKHLGLVFKDDIFIDFNIGDKLTGVVKRVRSDNKLDIVLNQIGFRNIEPSAQILLKALKDNDSYLELNDKSSPKAIKNQLNMSKKRFKKAVGHLYKKKLIELKLGGIYLKKNTAKA